METTTTQELPLINLLQLTPTLMPYIVALVLISLRKHFAAGLNLDWARLLAATALAASAWHEVSNPFGLEAGDLLLHDPFSRYFKLTALIGASALILFYRQKPGRDNKTLESSSTVSAVDFISAALLSAGGLMFLASAYDLFAIILGVELAIAPLYIYLLFSYQNYRHSNRGRWRLRTTALRVVSYGVFSSALLIFGIAILYGISGATDLIQVRINLSIVFLTHQKIGPALLLASTLIAAGFAAKMGLVPFHFWLHSLNSEESAFSAPGAARLALYSGLCVGVIGVMRIFDNALVAFAGTVMTPLDWPPVLLLIVTITTTIAAAAAFRQENPRAQLYWLALAQGSYALVGALLHSEAGVQAALSQIFVVTLTLLVAYSLIENILADNPAEGNSENALKGFGRSQPLSGLALAFSLASLGALPATAGFIARLDTAKAALNGQAWWAFVITAVTSAVLAVVSLRLIYRLYQRPSPEAAPATGFSFPMRFAGAIACAAILYLGLAPDTLRGITQEVSRAFAF